VRDRAAFAAIRTDSRLIRVFEKGKDKREDIESALKVYRKDFKFAPNGPAASLQPGAAQ
jgi:hypothetical protein